MFKIPHISTSRTVHLTHPNLKILLKRRTFSTMESSNGQTKSEDEKKNDQNNQVSPSKLKREVYAIFGLGNPYTEHIGTRHNVGYDFIEYLVNNIYKDASLTTRKFHSLYGETTIQQRKAFLVQPQTFMNLSGKAVRDLASFYKIKHKRIIVVHDDLDLPLGTLRLKNRGSSGGQNGVEDILKHIGKDSDFIRIRVGIGKPETMDTAKYVLKKFLPEEKPIVETTWKRIHQAIECIIGEGLEKTMSLYNKSWEQFEKQERDAIKREKMKEKLEAQKQKEAQENKDNNNSTTQTTSTTNKEDEEEQEGSHSPPSKRIKSE